jgi:polyisoprenoid-binding protein YceI
MMKKLLLASLLVLYSFGAELTVSSDSKVRFSATKMLFVGVEGIFSEFGGTVDVVDGKISTIKGEVTIDSIATGDEERDGHLKELAWFDTATHPTMSFQSTSINAKTVVGNLTIKGITKEVTFDIVTQNIGDQTAQIELSSEVDRKDFGLDGNMSFIIKDNIVINLLLKAQ